MPTAQRKTTASVKVCVKAIRLETRLPKERKALHASLGYKIKYHKFVSHVRKNA